MLCRKRKNWVFYMNGHSNLIHLIYSKEVASSLVGSDAQIPNGWIKSFQDISSPTCSSKYRELQNILICRRGEKLRCASMFNNNESDPVRESVKGDPPWGNGFTQNCGWKHRFLEVSPLPCHLLDQHDLRPVTNLLFQHFVYWLYITFLVRK